MDAEDVVRWIRHYSSNNPDSKRYANQMTVYSRGIYKPILFGLENIKKGAVEKTELR